MIADAMPGRPGSRGMHVSASGDVSEANTASCLGKVTSRVAHTVPMARAIDLQLKALGWKEHRRG